MEECARSMHHRPYIWLPSHQNWCTCHWSWGVRLTCMTMFTTSTTKRYHRSAPSTIKSELSTHSMSKQKYQLDFLNVHTPFPITWESTVIPGTILRYAATMKSLWRVQLTNLISPSVQVWVVVNDILLKRSTGIIHILSSILACTAQLAR